MRGCSAAMPGEVTMLNAEKPSASPTTFGGRAGRAARGRLFGRLGGHVDRRTLAAWLVVGLGALLLVAPLYFTFVFASHSRSAIFNSPPPLVFGLESLRNLDLLLERLPFWRNLGMSLYVAGMSTALNLVLCAMAGYG